MEIAASVVDIFLNRTADIINVELKNFLESDEALSKLEATRINAQNLHFDVLASHSHSLTGLPTYLQNRIDCINKHCNEACILLEDLRSFAGQKSASSRTPVLCAILPSPWLWRKPHKISKLQRKLEAIARDLELLKGDIPSQTENRSQSCSRHRSSGIPLIGREDDIQDIVQELISPHSPNKGVSIVGMHGLGKTELALNILEHNKIFAEFSFRIPVRLDGDFNSNEVLDELIHHLESCGNNVLNQHRNSLLILLDNVLVLDDPNWDAFWSHINSRNIGGRRYTSIKILVTTPNPQVSKTTVTIRHLLKPLSDENCQQIIKERVTLHNRNLQESELSHVARDLSRKCAGLPEVARILGVHVAQCDAEERTSILDKDLWDLPVFQQYIHPRIWSSYLNMQPQLRQCVTYFSLFPHTYQFNINDLIHLWAVEGFIQQLEGHTRLEEIGKEYFKDLQHRSILLESNNVNHAGKPTFELHKFSHKFSERHSSSTYMRLDEGMHLNSLKNDACHLSVMHENIERDLWSKIETLKDLRTLLSLHQSCRIGHIHHRLFKALAGLRVLVLKGSDIVGLPSTINRLKRLRYLDISATPIRQLPESLCGVYTLEYLKLNDTPELNYLPEKFQQLTGLLYLDWETSDINRMSLPSNIGNLSRLQTLPLFPAGDKAGYYITELKNLNCLQGSIRITNLQNVQNKAEADKAMLCNKKFLERLELVWNGFTNNSVAKDVLKGLKPHHFLSELKVENYGSDMFPNWITKQSQLKKIHFRECQSTILPALGKLPLLKSILIEECRALRCVNNHFYGTCNTSTAGRFPLLESLTLKNLGELLEWTDMEANDMGLLRVLIVMNCPRLTTLPSLSNLTSLVDLQIEGCRALESLPDLPDSIRSLVINDCDLLTARCQVGGEDWEKIIGFPEALVDGVDVLC